MTSERTDRLRWFLVLPLAVAAAALTQVVATSLAYSIALAALGPDSGEAWWLAKAVATPFMGAAFIGTAWWSAPSRKPSVAVLALGAVTVWATYLVVSSVGRDGFPWPALLGALGLAGGLLSIALLDRRPSRLLRWRRGTVE